MTPRSTAGDQKQRGAGISIWANWLSKFHTWPEFIQALWLIAMSMTLLGVIGLVMRGLHDLICLARRERGTLIYGVYRDAQGRWMAYRRGREPKGADQTSSGDSGVPKKFGRPINNPIDAEE